MANKMGVDFQGTSRLRTTPLPAKWYRKPVPATRAEIEDLRQVFLNTPADIRCLIMVTHGASWGPDGQLILPPKIVISSEEREAAHEELAAADPEFYTICWETNTVYYKTKESKTSSCYHSYWCYDEFLQDLWKHNNGQRFYMPPSTDTAPENGFLSADRAQLALDGMNRVRHHYVSPDWHPGAEEDDENTRNTKEWSLAFKRLYTCLYLASECGLLTIF